jgi:hypothetical protein
MNNSAAYFHNWTYEKPWNVRSNQQHFLHVQKMCNFEHFLSIEIMYFTFRLFVYLFTFCFFFFLLKCIQFQWNVLVLHLLLTFTYLFFGQSTGGKELTIVNDNISEVN